MSMKKWVRKDSEQENMNSLVREESESMETNNEDDKRNMTKPWCNCNRYRNMWNREHESVNRRTRNVRTWRWGDIWGARWIWEHEKQITSVRQWTWRPGRWDMLEERERESYFPTDLSWNRNVTSVTRSEWQTVLNMSHCRSDSTWQPMLHIPHCYSDNAWQLVLHFLQSHSDSQCYICHAFKVTACDRACGKPAVAWEVLWWNQYK